MKGFGVIGFILIALCILMLAFSSPTFGFVLIIVSVMQVLLHFSWRSIFGNYFHRQLGVVLTLIVLFIYRMILRAKRYFVGKKEQAALERIEQPKVAESSIQLINVHPKVLNRPLSVILGYSRNRPVVADLSREHTLIAGSTRTGKTNLILSILIQLCSKPESKRPDIYIIDLKADRDEGLYKFSMFARYVSELEEAISLLNDLHSEMLARFAGKKEKKPAVLIIDEIHSITKGDYDKERRKAAVRILSLLTAKAASSGVVIIISTQYPRYDVLDKTIVFNLLRKVCLPVDTKAQAEVIFGFRPDWPLPELSGEFIAKDERKPKRGRSLLVRQSEIDQLILQAAEDVDDNRLLLWKMLSSGKRIGASVPGMNKLYVENKELGQTFIREAYRHFALAGALVPPKRNGQPNKVAMEFIDGLAAIKAYVQNDKWTSAPDPFLRAGNAELS